MSSPHDQLLQLTETIRRRNRRELAALILIELGAGAFLAWVDTSAPLGSGAVLGYAGLLLAGATSALVFLTLGRPPTPPPAGADLASHLAAAQTRQARLLTLAPLWYVLPLLGATYGWLAGVFNDLGQAMPTSMLAVFVAIGVLVSGVNLASARALRSAARDA